MTAMQELPVLGPIARYEQNIIDRICDFNDPRQEWRRLFSELLGTFFLVLAAAGGGMMGHAFPEVISHQAAVVAPALTVMAIILFMGKVSGAHLNPAVSIAFALRRDFPWQRVPGYVVVQLIGATLAALFLHAVINVSAVYGSNYPAHGYSDMAAFWMELILTMGLVSVILGTASGAQNIGLFGAFGVGGYIALAGLWGSPISGASMNPARTFGPDLVSTTFNGYWVYVAGPLAGAVARRRRRLRSTWSRWRQVRLRGCTGRHLHRDLRGREILSCRIDQKKHFSSGQPKCCVVLLLRCYSNQWTQAFCGAFAGSMTRCELAK